MSKHLNVKEDKVALQLHIQVCRIKFEGLHEVNKGEDDNSQYNKQLLRTEKQGNGEIEKGKKKEE